MSSDLRAPDPTLAALGAEDVTLTYQGDRPPVAHRLLGLAQMPACGDGGDELRIDADWSAWFAVPCRDCFPYAPPPGRRFADSIREDCTVTYAPGDLAWQVPDREVSDG